MRYVKLILSLIGICAFTNVWAQLSTNEKPVSFGRESEMRVISKSAQHSVTMPQLDMVKIEKEDSAEIGRKIPPRFGYRHKVDYNLDNSGIWYELPNGDKLWQLDVVCPEAMSINFCYDKFWIPEGGKFFVYSKDKKHTLGAFTSRNNKGDRDNIRGFATVLVHGSEVVLEYYQPKKVSSDAIISIEYIVHGYKHIDWGGKSYGDPDNNCMVNINCSEGMSWQKEKKAVALILVNNYRYATGALINTTNLDHKPYLLTADHCLEGWANNNVHYDADTLPNLDHYTFYWNYEAAGCINEQIEPTPFSTSGAYVVANNSYSDFALLRLTDDPINLSSYTPYYLGWDYSGNVSGLGYVCIHHPLGDVKKISHALHEPASSSVFDFTTEPADTHWKIMWDSGVTNGGSSGSPLMNNKHRIIGQLSGGYSDCNGGISLPDWYGKFSVSWTGNNNASMQRRLNCWLDSLNIGGQTWEGLYILSTDSIIYTTITDNLLISNTGQLTITSDVSMEYNTHLVVESGGKLIIDGGRLSNVDLILRPGAILQIKNEGILETRKGFKAPKGAIVDIKSGEIW